MSERERQPYPAISDHVDRSLQIAASDRVKCVAVELRPWMKSAADVAQLVARAVDEGARVLVVRNTVTGVLEVQAAIEALLGLDHPALFRCAGVVCPHHGRYAAVDRRLLDQAVEDQFGRRGPAGARLLCGSQTLEQSLDIDADLLITDLAPIDVLLQRFGRLHRHPERSRPIGFRSPMAIVLTPAERTLLVALKGARGTHGIGGVYRNVLSIEATWRALEQHTSLRIPADNRMLVERCTDGATLAGLADQLGEPWQAHWRRVEGEGRAQSTEAYVQGLDWHREWDQSAFPADGETRIRTRLGADSLLVGFREHVYSPFAQDLESIAIPAWMLDTDARSPVSAYETSPWSDAGALVFSVGESTFSYGRLGLRK